jgi:hypothetical protein
MSFEPSHRTAAIAGVWSALGLLPADAWLQHNKTTSVLLDDLLWLLMLAVFFFVPFFYLVLGQNLSPFKRTWFLDSNDRARYAVVAKRMFIWFVGAGVTGIVVGAVGALLSHVWPK